MSSSWTIPYSPDFVIDAAPDTIVHLQTMDRSALLGERRAHDEAVVGAQALFGAIRRCRAIKQVVVKSSLCIYGMGPRRPSVVTETTRPEGERGRYALDLEQVEEYTAETAAFRDDAIFTVLRFAPVFGADVDDPLSRYLRLPVIPTRLGYDPRIQLLSGYDAVRVIEHTLNNPVPGTFNIAATGQLYLSRILRLGRRAAQPLPRRAYDVAVKGMSRTNLYLPEPHQGPHQARHGGRDNPDRDGARLRTCADHTRDRPRRIPQARCRVGAAVSYSELTKRQLMEMARQRGVRGRSKMTKQELVTVLESPPPAAGSSSRDPATRRAALAARLNSFVDHSASCSWRSAEGHPCGLPIIRGEQRCSLHGGLHGRDLAIPATGRLGFDTWPAVLRHIWLATYDVDPIGLDPNIADMAWHLLNYLYFDYFRVEVEGVENIPAEGPALLAANHGGAALPYDAAMLTLAVANEMAVPRRARVMATEVFNATPVLSHFYRKIGGVYASRDDAAFLLRSGSIGRRVP